VGQLAHFDLTALADRFNLHTFVETGTGRGDSLAYAAPHTAFTTLYSCEINLTLADRAVSRFAIDSRVHVHPLSSAAFLSILLPMLPRDPVLFWLDAHFPGADYGLAPYTDPTISTAVRLPLSQELAIIHQLRPTGAAGDVILIDDARIWLDMAFGSGPLPPAIRPLCPAARDIDFIVDRFADTHNVTVDPSHEGYIVLTPRGKFSVTSMPRALLEEIA
jgi:hypothetical protein